VLVGIEDEDGTEDIEWLSGKIVNLRIFDDEQNHEPVSGRCQRRPSCRSQFTLHASTRKGEQPIIHMPAKPDTAIHYMKDFSGNWKKDHRKPVSAAIFGAMMKVSLLMMSCNILYTKNIK